MISGFLYSKHGVWYAVLGIYDSDGNRKNKWINTGLAAQGNKRKADAVLQELRMQFSYLQSVADKAGNILFCDYMLNWLEMQRATLSPNTYYHYSLVIQNQISPYFRELGLQLRQLNEEHIRNYYDYLYHRGLSPNTVQKHHANIRKALQSAYERNLVLYNVADRVNKPQKQVYHASTYSNEEARLLLEAVKGTQLELSINLALFYGLRRSELLGIKWKAVNLQENTLTISHTVVRVCINGQAAIIGKDKVKRSKSHRTYPLPDHIKSLFLSSSMDKFPEGNIKHDDYVFASIPCQAPDPDSFSRTFKKLLADNGLRQIRFHDIRHTCANLLINARISLPEIQQWMGHSCISTTIDQYGHLEFSSKLNSAAVMSNMFSKHNTKE